MRKVFIILLLSFCLSGCAVGENDTVDSIGISAEPITFEQISDGQQSEAINVIECEGTMSEDGILAIYGEYRNCGILIDEIASYNGKKYTKELENGIEMNAQVFVPDISELNVYSYETKICDDSVRNEILEAVFEQGIDLFDEDIRNPGYFEYKYGDRAGDYYLYHTLYPCAGPTVNGEMAFMLYNVAPNLYPFEDNIVPESDSFSVIIKQFDPFDMAEQVVENIDCYNGWEMQYFVPYGTYGRTSFFRMVYKMKQDNLYVNAYNDTYFLVDQTGIQTFTGDFFDLVKESTIEQVVTLEDAIDVLERELPGTEANEYSDVVIDRITIEYVVIQEEDGGVSCFPFWRFYMSYEEYAKRENQNLICGVNMITGEFLYEERGFWF